MLRIAFLSLALVCAFSLGRISKPEIVRTVHEPGPVSYVMPQANRGAEITPGLRWLNMESAVPIFQVDNENGMRALIGYEGSGFVFGAYTHDPSEAIYILGTWTFECETALHEYTHMLEANMPDQAWRIRQCFHRLCSDRFRMDQTDLIPVLPDPALTYGPPLAPSP